MDTAERDAEMFLKETRAPPADKPLLPTSVPHNEDIDIFANIAPRAIALARLVPGGDYEAR